MATSKKLTQLLPGSLTSAGPAGTLAGGTEGQGQGEALSSAFSASGQLNLVLTLDTALGALVGMLAAVARPHAKGARERLDHHYETLITSLEEWRDAVPKV